ncbi:PREDICTED: annexin A3 [Cyprinodon variegatus]|uniref:Annexin n=1 Tax=Cyprinodon variegatus TaxID=28743 RepID=A0A3Q2EJ48_CYPVA|nr:PREDICTED: annexin A3 [Cyprinodon variegatus]
MGSLWDDLEGLVNSPVSSSAQNGHRGTIKPKANFDAKEDAAALKEAIEGFGTNEKVLIEILTQRSNAQRQLICKAYEKETGRTLEKDLKGDTGGDFEDLLVALITPPAAFDCHEVIRAMKGAGTKEKILIEIFASRTNQQIRAIQEVFLKEEEKKLTDELESDVSGDLSKALLILAGAERDEDNSVNVEKAKQDAETLYKAGEKKWGTDESKFIEILCRRSIPQLRQTFFEYLNISGKTLQQSIEGEMSGELEELLVAIVKCAKSLPVYFAELLHESMKGGGTHESTLTRILVSRSEIDLLDIRAEFKKLYEESLFSALDSDVGGEYGDCIKAICGGDD